jgi:guanylate cyclase
MAMPASLPGNILSRAVRAILEAGDTEEQRWRKSLLLGSSAVLITAGLLWGGLYLAYGEPVAGSIPIGYSLVSLLSFGLYLVTRNYPLYRNIQLAIVLVLPFLLMVALGGFVNSSAVILWSVLAPFGALLFSEFRQAPRWMVVYLVLVLFGGILHPYARESNNLPPSVIVPIFYVLNIAAVSGIAFVLLYSFVRERDRAFRLLQAEQARADQLLINVLPKEIASVLKAENRTIAESFDEASVLFADIVGSTPLFAELEPAEAVDWLNEIFSMFDRLVEKYGLEKIRTIGDNYMVASGVPRPRGDHALAIAGLALEMVGALERLPARSGRRVEFRIGINSGPLVAGVIGRTKFHYDLWGDTVNTASRMEAYGEPGKIHITRATYDLLKQEFECVSRGVLSVKGKGEMETWFLLGRRAGRPPSAAAGPTVPVADSRNSVILRGSYPTPKEGNEW